MDLFNSAPLSATDVHDRERAFKNLQGYTLVNHGRTHVWLGLLKFVAPEAERSQIRAFLKGFGQSVTPAHSLITTYQDYLTVRERDAAAARALKAAALSKPISALGISATGLSVFSTPESPSDEAWRAGFPARFKQRQEGETIPGYDAVLVLAANDTRTLAGMAEEYDRVTAGLAELTWEKGEALHSDNLWREHFGYADNLSQPEIFAGGQTATNGSFPHAANCPGFRPFLPLSMFLIEQPPHESHQEEYGSFMAYLKITQDVDAFEKLIDECTEGGMTPDDARTWLLGRGRDGMPSLPTSGPYDNDFDFCNDRQGMVCPVASHIRKANQRSHRRHIRILRRGVPYTYEDDKGLLFQSFQSDLIHQFEQILFDWLLNPNFPVRGTGQDAILGERDKPVLATGASFSGGALTSNRLTRILTGEYFYFPSIPFFGRAQV